MTNTTKPIEPAVMFALELLKAQDALRRAQEDLGGHPFLSREVSYLRHQLAFLARYVAQAEAILCQQEDEWAALPPDEEEDEAEDEEDEEEEDEEEDEEEEEDDDAA